MARPGYALGMQRPFTFPLVLAPMNALAAPVAGTIKFRVPQRCKLIGVTINVAEKGGTHGTNTIDILEGATSLLSALIDVGTLVDGTSTDVESFAAAADIIEKDAVLSITLAVAGGSSPTWRGATLQLDFVPLGD